MVANATFTDEDRKSFDHLIKAGEEGVSKINQRIASIDREKSRDTLGGFVVETLLGLQIESMRKRAQQMAKDLDLLKRVRPLLDAQPASNAEPGPAAESDDSRSTQPSDTGQPFPGRMTKFALGVILESVQGPEFGDVKYRTLGNQGHLICVGQKLPDRTSPQRQKTWQYGRWWYVSCFATDGEVVQTLLLAWKTFQEHELREQFKYNGEAIFHPHQPVDKLVSFTRQTDRELRSDTRPSVVGWDVRNAAQAT